VGADKENYSEEETVERREAALKRMLATPHQKHEPLGVRKTAMPPLVAIDGGLFVADIKERRSRSITADLYRNLKDFRQGAAMERGVRLILG